MKQCCMYEEEESRAGVQSCSMYIAIYEVMTHILYMHTIECDVYFWDTFFMVLGRLVRLRFQTFWVGGNDRACMI